MLEGDEPGVHREFSFPFFFLIVIIIVVVTVSASTAGSLHSILANGNLDALQCEAFAELGALDNTRELLSRENLEGFAEDGSQNGSRSVVDHGSAARVGGLRTHVDEAHFKPINLQQSDQYRPAIAKTYRKVPSVRTLKSCKINHTPILLSGSVKRKALALRLPIRFRVNMPPGPPETGCAGDMAPGI